MNNDTTLYILTAIGFGLFGLAYGLGQHKKLDDISDKLDRSIDKLKKDSVHDISEAIVERAVQQAATVEVGRVASRVAKNLENGMRSDIRREVGEAVDQSKKEIKGRVESEIKQQVTKLDIEDIKQEAIEAGKEAALEKLKSSMDDILENFNGNLKNIADVYKSIAGTITGSNQKSFNLNLT